ncbi:MAG: hypothetical protein P8101_20290 [Candidatus Thiodiazotropha sp.]
MQHAGFVKYLLVRKEEDSPEAPIEKPESFLDPGICRDDGVSLA